VRELSVYDSGAWKTPGYAYVYRDGNWVRATEIHMFRNGAWTSVWDQQTLYVPSSATTLSMLKATQGVQPNSTYWNTLINGRRLGDINNSGSVTSADVNIMLFYAINPASVTADQRQWIEVAIIPYATDYPPP
jgi:hypothetical protein